MTKRKPHPKTLKLRPRIACVYESTRSISQTARTVKRDRATVRYHLRQAGYSGSPLACDDAGPLGDAGAREMFSDCT